MVMLLFVSCLIAFIYCVIRAGFELTKLVVFLLYWLLPGILIIVAITFALDLVKGIIGCEAQPTQTTIITSPDPDPKPEILPEWTRERLEQYIITPETIGCDLSELPTEPDFKSLVDTNNEVVQAWIIALEKCRKENREPKPNQLAELYKLPELHERTKTLLKRNCP